jgi:PAS domain S-box-containing protein
LEVEEQRLVAARAATRAAELQARRHALLAELGRTALQGATALELFDDAVAQAPGVLECGAVVILELDPDGDALVVRAGHDPLRIPAGGEAFELRPVLADGPAVWSAADGTPGSALPWPQPVRSALGALIRGPQRNFGVLAVYRTDPEPFHEDDVVWVRSLANVLGAAVARERAEQELRTRDVQNRLTLAAGRMGSWRWDPATGEVWWSPELEHVYGFAPGSFRGTFAAYADAIHPHDRDRVAAAVEAARDAGRDFTVEHRIVRPADGEVRWIEGRGSPLRDPAGEVEQWIGIAIDITARVERDEELRQREIQTRFAFAAGRMGSWTWDPETDRGTISVELEALLGIPPGSYDGTWAGFVAPIMEEDHDILRDEVVGAAATGREFTARYRIRRTDGEIRWMESRGRRAAAGEWVGVTIDVTEPMQLEQERQRNAALLRATYDTAPVGLAFLDRQLRVQFVNEHLAQLHGRPADLHVDRQLVEIVPEIGGPIEAELAHVLADGAPRLQFEVRGTTAASPSEPRVFEASGYPVVVDGGEVIGVGLVLVDTTERRREQRALVDAHDRLGETVGRLDSLLERGPFGFAFLDRGGRVIGLNQRYADLTGVPLERHVGHRLASVAPRIAVPVMAAARTVLNGATTVDGVEITTKAPDPDGGERFWLLSHFPVRDAGGAISGVGSLAVDITEQRRRERAARLAARVGDLVHRDDDAVLQLAAEATVAEFADLCLICVPPVGGVPRRSAVAYADPRVQQALADADERWPIDVDRLRDALGDRDYLLVPEVSDAQRHALLSGDPAEAALVELAGVRSALLAPLRVGPRDLGVVVFAHSDASGRSFREPDAGLACDLAARMAQLVERRALAREADRAVARLGLLAAISELLTVDLDSQARLDAIVDVVVPIFADTCSVYVPVDGGIEMGAFASIEPLAQAEYHALEGPIRHELGESVPQAEVMRTGESMLVSDFDVRETEQWDSVGARLRAAAGSGSFILVPLPGLGGPIGVIGFALRGHDRRFEESDLPLAEEIARRVSPAVENAWRFEREAATAEQLQRVLLPERLAHPDSVELAARYLPSSVDIRVGGDWYDAVELPAGELLVAIGDVVGHGGAAATWMGKLRSVVQFCGLDGRGPASTLQHVNEYCQLLPGSDMTTVMIAVYDPVTSRLRFASAGHPPAMVRAADGEVRTVWEGRGPPLGALDHPQFDEAEIELGAGDLLVLYTDGLIERRGESLDRGLERLGAALGPATGAVEESADHLLAELLGGSAAADDVALLLMRLRDTSTDLTLRLRADPRELVRLRRATRAWLRRSGCGDDRVGEVLVAVNELAANAIEHAYGPAEAWFEVAGRIDDGVATFEVRDFGRWRASRPGTHRGRGLRLVADLTDDFSLDHSDAGTIARFRVRLEDV